MNARSEVSGFAPTGFGFERLLASGPFFRVALVTRGDLRFVCKRPSPRFAEEQVALDALDAELGALTQLDRAGAAAPRVHARSRDAEGEYLVTSFVSGVPLSELSPAAMPPPGTLARRLFEALADVHEAGVVHGDPSPDNVMIHAEKAVLVDFGLARLADRDDPERPREVRGTVDYVAPEVARGETHATFASDVFSLAAVLHRVLTGSSPRGRGVAPSFAAALVIAAERVPDTSVLDHHVPGLGAALAMRPEARPDARTLARFAGRRPSS